MSVLHKAFPVEIKAIDEDQGIVEAVVSVFGNVDLGGDRVVKGAFEKSLARWREKGDPIPVVFSHDWGDLWSHIGYADPNDVTETDVGLKARYRLDIDDNPAARQAFKLMRRRTLKEHSFAYSVPEGGERVAKDGATDLLELDVHEIGPTLKGMNPDTELLAVKSAIEDAAKQQGEAPGGSDGEDPGDQDEPPVVGKALSDDDLAKLRAASDALTKFLDAHDGAEEEPHDPPPDPGEGEKAPGDEAEADVKAEAEGDGKASVDDDLLNFRTQIDYLKELR